MTMSHHDQSRGRFIYRKGRALRHLTTALGLWCVATLSLAETPSPALSLEAAVAMVVSENPGLAAIQARATALAKLPEQADALPDPRLSVNLLNMPLDSFSFSQEPMTQFQVGISQALPYPGKLRLRAESARHEAGAAEADVAEKRLQLVRDVRTVWWNLFYLDRAVETVEKNYALLTQFVSIAETRYQVGQGLQQDVLLAQLELSKLRDARIRLLQLRNTETIRLNLLLNRPSDQAVRLADQVMEDLPPLARAADLQQRARERRPLLSAQQQRTEAAQRRLELAHKDYAPDFMLGAVYGFRDGDNPDGSRRADFGSILFSMNLPLYSGSKQDQTVDQRNAEWLQKKYELHEQGNQIGAEVSQAITDYQRAAEQLLLFRQEIIPQARQTVDAMLGGYQVGKVDFLNLVRSQTTLYDYETQYWKALSAANQALARLMAAVGEENIYE